ncbi:MAG: hypothetical protein R3D98_04405 [Candidatus Krumholzibacteriia bacterium]
MIGSRRALATLGLVMVLAGCGGRPPAGTDPGQAADRDWYRLDRNLTRGILGRYTRWFADEPRPRLVARRAALTFAAPLDSLGPAAFAELPAAEQAERRRQAGALLDRASLLVRDRAERLQFEPVRGSTFDRFVLRGLQTTFDEVLSSLHGAVGLDPGNADAWYALAYFSAAVGDRATATRARLAYLEAAVTADPRGRTRAARAVLDEAWALREDGHHARCRLWLDAHRGLIDVAPPVRDALPPRVERDLMLGLLAAEARDRTATLAWINRLPAVPVQRHGVRRDSHYLRTWVRAWLEFCDGNLDAATRAVSQRSPERLHTGVDWRFYQDLGQICDVDGQRDAALRFWGVAMRLRPYLGFYPQTVMAGPPTTLGIDGTDAPYVIGYRTHWLGGSAWGFAATRVLLCQVHQPADEPRLWQEAFDSLDRCIRRQDHPGQARLLRARLNLQLGRLDAAEADLRDAAVTRLAAGQTAGEVAFLRGVVACNGGDLAAALPLLERATALDSTNARPWQALAVSLAYLGRDREARRAFDRTVRLAPQDGAARFNRGLFLLQHGERDLAERDLLAASQLMADNSRAVHLLQAVASGREVTVDTTPQAIRLVASDAEIRQAGELAAVMEADPDELLASLGDTPEERQLWLDLLDERYRDHADPAARRALAEARTASGDPQAVRGLLGPEWPDGLGPRERVLLLLADRAVGDPSRARSLAAGEPDWLEPPLVIAAVTLLLDAGEPEPARGLLARARRRWPGQAALAELATRLPAGP